MQNLKWRVGVAVSSSKCKSLSSPYVLLSFDVRELDGTVTQHSCELSYEQFQVRHYREVIAWFFSYIYLFLFGVP
jgi:hypothetical protein